MFGKIIFIPMILFYGFFLLGCSKSVAPSGASATGKQVESTVPSPPCIIYKTNGDLTKNVPVILSEDGTSIVSYPDVKDLFYKGALAYPTPLKEDFLLDNRGIGPQVAFLNITYESYSKLDKTPSPSELMALILDKNPLTEMYQCGSRSHYSDPEKELNEIISSGKLGSCKRLK
jgi:hypothetical protein